ILYTISDETFTASATVDINVFLPPVAPIANNDNYEVERNTVLIIEAPGILENDTDENGDLLTVTEFTINGNTYAANETVTLSEGVLTINENGSFVFQPVQDFIGDVPLIIYSITDGTFVSSGNLNIEVVYPPTAPIPLDDYDTVEINTTLNVATPGVLINDTDINEDELTVTEFVINGIGYLAGEVAEISEGSFTLNLDGSYQFIPTTDYFGDVPPITYKITDGIFEGQALLYFTIERVTDLLNIVSFESCNQGYTVDEEYKVIYSVVLENTSTARDYNESSLLKNIDLQVDLEDTFGLGCIIEVTEVDVFNNGFTRDFINNTGYPREFDQNAINNNFLNGTSSSFFNQEAVNNLTLYPRQSIILTYCVTIDPFCNGRPNPTPSGSGLDFTSTLNITADRGAREESLTLTDFHTTNAIVTAGLFVPEFNDSIDPPGTINFDGTYDYRNTVIITNEGTAVANNINYNMGLGHFMDNGISFTELDVNQVSGPPVTVNPNYNGDTDTFLLTSNNSLAAGDVVILELFYEIAPYASTTYSNFYQVDRSFSQGNLDDFDETTLESRRLDSYVIWSDDLGDHLDRYYVANSATESVSSSNQCDCSSSSMRFLFDSQNEVNKTIASVNTIPNGILEHEEIIFNIQLSNTSEAVQLTNLQLLDDITTNCGSAIVNVGTPLILNSTATTNPTINTNFNGISDPNIFIGTDGVLRANEQIVIQLSVTYSEFCSGENTVTFTASNPLGSLVSSSSAIAIEASTDSDNDGVINSIDLDDDNDTIPDIEEYNGLDPLEDDDLDLLPNYRDLDFGIDANSDGIVDVFDFDNDGVPNHLDLDSDNDGIFDVYEVGNASVDENNSGTTNNSTGINGLDDTLESEDSLAAIITYSIINSDTDLNFDYLDIDSDGDGIVDNIEAQRSTNYIAPNSIINSLGIDTAYLNGLNPVDTENDGVVDYLDTNSDNDIRADSIEGWDIDADGIAEVSALNLDVDSDGLDDAFDNDVTIRNATNNQTPQSFPNEDNIDTEELDWREIIAIIVRIDPSTDVEGNTLFFTLKLVSKRDDTILIESASPVDILFSSINGTSTSTQYETAVSPFDFTEIIDVNFSIPPFTNSIQFSVNTFDDDISELTESFTLNGTITSQNTQNTSITSIGSLLDNDDLPSITMNDSREIEGLDLLHTITLSNPSSRPIAINVQTSDASALRKEDYLSVRQNLEIEGTENPNLPNTSVSFSIPTLLDNLNELDEEYLTVTAEVTSNNIGTQDLNKTGTIVDIDPNPFLEITDATIEEGGVLEFTISLLNQNLEPMQNYLPIQFILETVDDTTFGSEDYIPINLITSIPAFETIYKQEVVTIDDRLNEETEQLFLRLTTNLDNISNEQAPSGVGIIKDNDYPNLFSPNGDGISDVFKISGIVEDYPNFKLVIVNRLGNEVYRYSNNGSMNPSWWDGTYQGKKMPTGVYFYTLDYNDGLNKPKSNFIQLIR
uniref:T9SS type B sorting domain-containing protein n=1 Tax=Polaribacter sp. TaxID=1920175 RepID=UPI003F69C081